MSWHTRLRSFRGTCFCSLRFRAEMVDDFEPPFYRSSGTYFNRNYRFHSPLPFRRQPDTILVIGARSLAVSNSAIHREGSLVTVERKRWQFSFNCRIPFLPHRWYTSASYFDFVVNVEVVLFNQTTTFFFWVNNEKLLTIGKWNTPYLLRISLRVCFSMLLIMY